MYILLIATYVSIYLNGERLVPSVSASVLVATSRCTNVSSAWYCTLSGFRKLDPFFVTGILQPLDKRLEGLSRDHLPH